MFWIFYCIFYLLYFFLLVYGFFLKLLRLPLKATKVTTGHQKWPKMGPNSIISSFFATAEG